MTERLTEEVLQELLDAPSLDAFVDGREFPAETLAGFLGHMLEKKGSSVVSVGEIPA